MKIILISFIFSMMACASEMDRIQDIVLDIENLREDYEKCIKSLGTNGANNIISSREENDKLELIIKKKNKELIEYKKDIDIEKLKNNLLLTEVETLKSKLSKNNTSTSNITTSNDKSNKKYNILLLNKEKEINNLRNMYSEYVKKSNITISSLKNQIKMIKKSSDDCNKNTFPKLAMKDNITKNVPKDVVSEVSSSRVVSSKAFAYRLTKDSDIYESIDGELLERWEARTSFTSNISEGDWIKITGYFIDKKWQKATQELWVKKINTIKR